MSEKRIGYVDYQLDNFHANVYLSALRGPLAERGYTIAGATAWQREPSESWAKEKQLPYYESVDELAAQVDYFMVLAPANPELHLEMCESVFPHGKPTFVDKTFAPDLQTAEKVFELADTHGIATQTTSALRTSSVQKQLATLSSSLEGMFIVSSGPTFDEYGIHPVELAVSCMGHEVQGLMRLGADEHPRFVLNFSDDRTAIIDFNQQADVPYSATLVTGESCVHTPVDLNALFIDAAAGILSFFDAGRPLIDRRETLRVRQILDLAMLPELAGKFVDLTNDTAQPSSIPAPHWETRKVTQP